MFFINHKEIEHGKAAIVEIEGPLNSESGTDFDDYTKKLIENETLVIIVDFKKLNFISSEGIGAALMLHKRITAANGTAVFCNLNNEVTALLRILGLNRVFTIAENISEALDMIECGITGNEHSDEATTERPKYTAEYDKDETITLPEPELSDFDEPLQLNDDFEFIGEETIEPFVIECLKCGSLVRIKEKGNHICPFCEAEFNVSDDGKALFKIDGQ